MIQNERDIRHEQALAGARQMMVAARTAPKAKGFDIIEVALVEGEDLQRLAAETEQLADDGRRAFFVRDAGCLRASECVVLVGTREKAQTLDCARCGFSTCASRSSGVPCAINCVDVGIAVGSACSLAADLRLDTRVMFSAGFVAEQMGLLEVCRQVYAIPVSVSSKSPFFDRG